MSHVPIPATPRSTAPEIDLCVNCYERTYREVLAPGFFARLLSDFARRFHRRTVLINNVSDRTDAERRANAMRAAGELDAWYFVEDHIAQALAITGVRADDIARAPYFTDWGLVLVSVPGPDWFVHCDPEVRLREPADWVTPSIELMLAEPAVAVTNPRWHVPRASDDSLHREAFEYRDGFAVGLGFSDQLFLARRSELAAPIYSERCLASRRYPMIHVTRSFEARIDSWMRHSSRLRATFLGATYVHPDEIGGAYPKRTPREMAAAVVNRASVAAIRHAPFRPACWRGL